MKNLLSVLVLLAAAVPASAQCVSGRCGAVVVGPPPIIYRPVVQVQVVPYQYQATVIEPHHYQGPLWTGLFGRWRAPLHVYAPQPQQQGQKQ